MWVRQQSSVYIAVEPSSINCIADAGEGKNWDSKGETAKRNASITQFWLQANH